MFFVAVFVLLFCTHSSALILVEPTWGSIWAWQNATFGQNGSSSAQNRSVEIFVSWKYDKSDPGLLDFLLYNSDASKYLRTEDYLHTNEGVPISKLSMNLTFPDSGDRDSLRNGSYYVQAWKHGGDSITSSEDFEILTVSPTVTSSSPPNSLSTSTKAAIGLGVVLILLVVLLLIYFLLLCRRRRQVRLDTGPGKKSRKKRVCDFEVQDLREFDGNNRTSPQVLSRSLASIPCLEATAIPHMHPVELESSSGSITGSGQGKHILQSSENTSSALPNVNSHVGSTPLLASNTTIKKAIDFGRKFHSAGRIGTADRYEASPKHPTGISSSQQTLACTPSNDILPELEQLRARQRHLAAAIEATESLERLRSEKEMLEKEIKLAEERARQSIQFP